MLFSFSGIARGLSFEGLGFIPCCETMWPRKGISVRKKQHLLGFSLRPAVWSLSKTKRRFVKWFSKPPLELTMMSSM